MEVVPVPILLKYYRKRAGKTQQDAADACGCFQPLVHRWEVGKSRPSPERLAKLCALYGVEGDVFHRTELSDLKEVAKAVVLDFLTRMEVGRDHERLAKVGRSLLDLPDPVYLSEVQQFGVADWRSSDLFAFSSSMCRETVRYVRGEETVPLVVSGPTRCGKTLRLLEAVLSLHFEIKGFRSLVLRSDAIDLGETIRTDLRDRLLKYPLDDPLSPVSVEGTGGERNFMALELNGGRMVLGGMNRPGRVLGTGYNLIYASQLEQFSEEQFNLLLTRCAGDQPGWVTSEGVQRGLFIGDANPDDADHWVKRYEAEGTLRMVDFGFDDNPLYFRNHRRTSEGDSVVGQLDRSLTGIYHDRFFKGLWVNVEGRVFNLESCHFVESVDEQELMFYRACDFGITSPSVCLWVGVHKVTSDVFVYREFRQTNLDTISLGEQIGRHSTDVSVAMTVIDNDEDKQKLLRQHCGIASELTVKGPHSVQDGIHLIQDGLRKAKEGLPGGLYFVRGLRCNADPVLIRDKRPLSIIDEMKYYAVDPESDKPLRGDDHGVDALRYFFLYYMSREGGVGYAGTSVERKKRL